MKSKNCPCLLLVFLCRPDYSRSRNAVLHPQCKSANLKETSLYTHFVVDPATISIQGIVSSCFCQWTFGSSDAWTMDVMGSKRQSTTFFIVCTCLYFTVISVNSGTTIDLLDNQDNSNGSPAQLSLSNETVGGKIPLALCCPKGSLYKTGLDACSQSTSNGLWMFPSPIYSVETNQIIAELTNEVVSLTYSHLDNCPDGFVSNSTRDFRLFNDGSLRIGKDRLEVDEFCINEIDSRLMGHVPDADPPTFAARFCVPDPCIANGPCIRKCCPLGSAIHSRPDELGSLCLPHPTRFDVSLLPFQSPEEAETTIDPTSFSVYGGLGLKCFAEGGEHFIDAVYPDHFFILADGRMNITYYPLNPMDERPTREFCVDQFYDKNETVS